jgi:predicted RNase H-like nuclease (RuvC/YqgF family)
MSYGERVIFYQDALMERNKRVDQLKAELTTLQSRLEAVEAERDEALARSRIADKDAEIATDHWYNQFEKQKARVEELQKALAKCRAHAIGISNQTGSTLGAAAIIAIIDAALLERTL